MYVDFIVLIFAGTGSSECQAERLYDEEIDAII